MRALLLAATGLLLAMASAPYGQTPGPAAGHGGLPARHTAADCRSCHAAVHDEWQGSRHAHAFTDPRFQQALAGRAQPERCVGCHAPQGVLERLGRRPNPRAERRHDGIDCASCHLRDGVVHGPFGGKTEAHATLQDPAFTTRGSAALCNGCHDLRIEDVLPLGREFLTSKRARDGDSCTSCHMPRVRRALANDPTTGAAVGEQRAGRSHRLRGPDDAEFCAEAFGFQAVRTPRGVMLTIENLAGHGVPGLVGREFVVDVAVLNGDAGVATHRIKFDAGNRLLVQELRRIEIGAPRSSAVRITVEHRLDGRPIATILQRRIELP